MISVGFSWLAVYGRVARSEGGLSAMASMRLKVTFGTSCEREIQTLTERLRTEEGCWERQGCGQCTREGRMCARECRVCHAKQRKSKKETQGPNTR